MLTIIQLLLNGAPEDEKRKSQGAFSTQLSKYAWHLLLIPKRFKKAHKLCTWLVAFFACDLQALVLSCEEVTTSFLTSPAQCIKNLCRSQRKKSRDQSSKKSLSAAPESSSARTSAERGKSKRTLFEEYAHLPWQVYGEGEPPAGWQQDEQADSFAVQIHSNLVPVKSPQGWTLGNLLTGVLQRGIKVCP